MRKSIIVAAVALMAGLGAPSLARAQCVPAVGPNGQVQTFCGDFRPLRIATAVTNGPPLIWSSAAGTVVPAPIYGRPRLVGPTIPLGAIVGRRVLPLTELPRAVVYNNPDSFVGAVDPGVVLMPVRPLRRIVVRERWVRTRSLVRLGRVTVIRAKD